MAKRNQNSFFNGDMNALGMMVVGDDNVTPYGPGVLALPAGGLAQLASPLTGATVALPDDERSGYLYLTPAGTIAALTVNLPTNAKSILGQVERFISSQTVTALTVAQAGGGLVAVGIPTTIGPAAPFALMKVAANTWALCP